MNLRTHIDFRPRPPNRREMLAALFATAASGALAGAPKRAPRPEHRSNKIRLQAAGDIESIVAAAGISGKTGFLVADATSGEILESRKPLLAMPPASATKALTTYFALGTLGSEHRFKTQLLATGPVSGGKLRGDLYLIGGGDPTLDTDALGEMAARLKEADVREITGKTFIYTGALAYQKSIDPGQPDHLGYNPSLSGLNLNYNRVFFEWKRTEAGYGITLDARALKFRPRVGMVQVSPVKRKAPIFRFEGTATQDKWTVASHALGKKGGRWLPVRRPGFYAADVFRTLARSHGIKLPAFRKASVRPVGTVLVEWKSAKLINIIKAMMRHSTNITAEAIGMSASGKSGGKPASLKASGREMAGWISAKTGARHLKFVDHSGLGDGSRISPHDMVKVLLSAGWNGALHGTMKVVPMRDDKGQPIKNHPIEVRAKTGTLNFVSALAGYMQASDGRKLVFAFFSSDLPKRASLKRAQRERPKGARGWNRRSKNLQRRLIERWGQVFTA